MDANEKEEEEEEEEEDSSFAKQKGCEHPFTAFRFFNGTPSARPPRLLYSSPSKARLAPMTGP